MSHATVLDDDDDVVLTAKQVLALEALLSGATDTDAAAAADVRRETLYRWKTRDPAFIAELNRRRREAWDAAQGRARQMVSDALRVMHESLTSNELTAQQRLGVAERIVKAFGGAEALGRSLAPGVGGTTSEEVAEEIARKDRDREQDKIRNAAFDEMSRQLTNSIAGVGRS